MYSHNVHWLVQLHLQQRLHEAEQDRLARQFKRQPTVKTLKARNTLGDWLIDLGLCLTDVPDARRRWNLYANTQTPTRIIKV